MANSVQLPVDTATFDALSSLKVLGQSHSDPRPPLNHPASPAATDALFDAALSMHLVNAVAHAYADNPHVGRSDSPFALYVRLATAVLKSQIEQLQDISTTLTRHGVPFLVFKGLYAYGHLGTIPPRVMADIDIIVRRDDIEKVRRLLTADGYTQGSDDVVAIRRIESQYYEMGAFSRIGYLNGLPEDLINFARKHCFNWYERQCRGWRTDGSKGALRWEFAVDVHHNIVHPPLSESELWRGATRVSVGGILVSTMRATLLLWLLCVRAYAEIAWGEKTAARMLAEAMLLTQRERIDFADLSRLCEHTTTSRQVFFVLSFLRSFCGAPIPAKSVVSLQKRARHEGVRKFQYNSGKDDLWAVHRHNGGDILPDLVGRPAPPAISPWTRYTPVSRATPAPAAAEPVSRDREVGKLTLADGRNVSIKM